MTPLPLPSPPRTPSLGADLSRVRERERQMTIRELARRTGLSAEAISSVERGRRYPSLRTLELLAEALNISFLIGPAETIIEH